MSSATLRCPECGTEVAPALRSCPACHRLVHAEELKRLAAEAERASQAGDAPAALASWRQALELLPPGSRQHATVSAKVAQLGGPVGPTEAAHPASAPPSWVRKAGPLGALALLLWKLKFALAALLSMLVSLGVYWVAWGWRFALGLVASIYVHELGHLAALRLRGVPASAPMFVPGLGAFVRHRPLERPEDEARVALAGPLWGLGAAIAAYAVHLATGAPLWAGLAQWGARLNLLNMIPVPPLDGGTAFRALSRDQRWVVVLTVGAVLYHTGEGLLWIVLLLAAARALGAESASEPDWTSLAEFVFLVAALAGLGSHVPAHAGP